MPNPIANNLANNPTPGTPTNTDLVVLGIPTYDTFTMHYRHGMNSKLEKNFSFKGDLESARRRAKEHCDIMGYKLIWVRPLVVDLEIEEAHQQGRKAS
jgi:hypothetical protein